MIWNRAKPFLEFGKYLFLHSSFAETISLSLAFNETEFSLFGSGLGIINNFLLQKYSEAEAYFCVCGFFSPPQRALIFLAIY